MIDIKEELIFDFGIKSPRIMITENLILIDNITRIIDFSDKMLITQTGKNFYTIVNGEKIFISGLQNSRVICSGKIASVEFHKNGNDIK